MYDLIIFSSSEQKELASAIMTKYLDQNIRAKVWSDGFFEISTYTMENFKNLSKNYKKALILLGKDDWVKSRDIEQFAPRDNAVLELGICIGALGLENTAFVYNSDIKIPSDLVGITAIPMPKVEDVIDKETLASAIISKLSQFMGVSSISFPIRKMIMWDEYVDLVNKLLGTLKQSVNFGGFYFDLILSVSRGGSMLAGVIARTYGQNMPILYLLEDRRDGNGAYDTLEVKHINQGIIKTIKSHKYKHILIVDSAVRTGKTLQRAKDFLDSELDKNVTIKSAVLLLDKNTDKDAAVDYYADKVDTLGTGFFYNQFG